MQTPDTAPLAKIENRKQYHISEGIIEISVINEDLKVVGVLIPTTAPFNLLISSVSNTNIS